MAVTWSVLLRLNVVVTESNHQQINGVLRNFEQDFGILNEIACNLFLYLDLTKTSFWSLSVWPRVAVATMQVATISV